MSRWGFSTLCLVWGIFLFWATVLTLIAKHVG